MSTSSYLKFYKNACKHMHVFLGKMKIKGLVNIEHDVTFGGGQISMLTPHLELIEFYNKNKPPLAYTNKSGRFLEEGVYINKVIEDQYPRHAKLMPLFLKIAHQLNLSYGENYIHYVIKETDCQHLYTLFFDLSYNDFLHYIINNSSLIKDTIEDYHSKAKDLIAEAKVTENRITLRDIEDFITDDQSNDFSITKKICIFHKNTNLPIHLSPQRGECLLYLVQGKSVKEIARAMNLTPKTIEHYLEILRKELGCRSSKELMAFYSEQLVDRVISPY